MNGPIHRLGPCVCERCSADRNGNAHRWTHTTDADLDAIMLATEQAINAAEDSTDEPNLTDDSPIRAARICASARAELARRARGDVPGEVAWRNGRERFLKQCERARLLAFHARETLGEHYTDDAQTAINAAAALCDGNPLITEVDITTHLAPVVALLEHTNTMKHTRMAGKKF